MATMLPPWIIAGADARKGAGQVHVDDAAPFGSVHLDHVEARAVGGPDGIDELRLDAVHCLGRLAFRQIGQA